MLLDYGQPLGAIMQYAYVVEDLDAAMQRHVDELGIGPWFVIGPFVPPAGIYRGKPADMTISLAMAFSGHAMIELIQQHDEKPSVYRETIERSGYGFHHYARLVKDMDGELVKAAERGMEVAFSDRIMDSRIAYLDTTDTLPGMVELVEYSPAIEAAQASIFRAAQGWDGSDPIRRLPAPLPQD